LETVIFDAEGVCRYGRSTAFLPDGKYVLTGSFDGTSRLWEANYHDFLATTCK